MLHQEYSVFVTSAVTQSRKPPSNQPEYNGTGGMVAFTVGASILTIAATIAVMKGPEIVAWLLVGAAVAPWLMVFKPWAHWNGWRWLYAIIISATALTAFAILKFTDAKSASSAAASFPGTSALPATASFKVESSGVINRCSVVGGRIENVPADHHPWLAWRGSGQDWYFKNITRISDSGDSWTLDLTIGSPSQGGQEFTLVPLLLPTAMDAYMQSQLQNDPPQLHNANLPISTKKFTSTTIMRGTNNCKP